MMLVGFYLCLICAMLVIVNYMTTYTISNVTSWSKFAFIEYGF